VFRFGTIGLIQEGDDKGKYVKIQELPDDPPSFLILLTSDAEFQMGAGDYWAEDFSSLQQFFVEAKWVIAWNE
jgi:hypothetical protein